MVSARGTGRRAKHAQEPSGEEETCHGQVQLFVKSHVFWKIKFTPNEMRMMEVIEAVERQLRFSCDTTDAREGPFGIFSRMCHGMLSTYRLQ
jgi:hypothetical protein